MRWVVCECRAYYNVLLVGRPTVNTKKTKPKYLYLLCHNCRHRSFLKKMLMYNTTIVAFCGQNTKTSFITGIPVCLLQEPQFPSPSPPTQLCRFPHYVVFFHLMYLVSLSFWLIVDNLIEPCPANPIYGRTIRTTHSAAEIVIHVPWLLYKSTFQQSHWLINTIE